MPENLKDKLQSMDENIAKITDASLHQLEIAITKVDYPDPIEVRRATDSITDVGEALKALADGLDRYITVSSYIQQR
jgi:hypothetical protein